MNLSTLLPGVLILFLSVFNIPVSIGQDRAEKWEITEIQFTGSNATGDPFAVELGAVFTHEEGTSMKVPGFYNGGKEWIIRFCPPATGTWSYRTYSSDPKMAGNDGSVSVVENTKDWQHGPLQISKEHPQKFLYADGTPYFLLAFELDWLFALDAQNEEDIPKTRKIISRVAEYGYNQIVMNVYAYNAGWGEKNKVQPENNYAKPDVFPFGGTNEEPDHSTLNVEFFQRFDRVIEHLNEKQVISHLMIYVWNKMVNWPEPGSEADNRYFDYVVKRYQAYPNLLWDISKEALAYGMDDMSYITGRIKRLRKLDGHDRLVTVHDYNYCRNYPGEVDIISIQEWTSYLYCKMREVLEQYDKPVFNIEHGGYEKTMHSIFDGAYTDPLTCLDRNYQCIFAGTYSTYYWQNAAWYNVVTDPFSLPEENQPNFIYYRHLASFFNRFNFNELYPESKAFAPPLLTNGKDLHIFYVSENRLGLFGELPDLTGKTVSIQWFDPLTGEYYDGGQRSFNEGTWMGVRRPESISGPMALAVFRVTEH